MLTDRQREIAEMLSRGHSYKSIARTLHISPRTVVNHVQDAAKRIEDANAMRPRDRVMLWFFSLRDRDAA